MKLTLIKKSKPKLFLLTLVCLLCFGFTQGQSKVVTGIVTIEGQPLPAMNDEVVQNITNRYIELYETLIGKKFVRETVTVAQIENIVNAYFN